MISLIEKMRQELLTLFLVYKKQEAKDLEPMWDYYKHYYYKHTLYTIYINIPPQTCLPHLPKGTQT